MGNGRCPGDNIVSMVHPGQEDRVEEKNHYRDIPVIREDAGHMFILS